MKILIFLSLFYTVAHAETWTLVRGNASYEVKHLLKTVSGESKELKGKIQCGQTDCEFLIAAPVKSFTSSDSNRDENMFNVTEAGKFPYTTASGKVSRQVLLSKEKSKLPIEIDFHGKKAQYDAELNMIESKHTKALVTIELDRHGIERPSLFGVKIEDKVPLTFDLQWEEK